ncbi:hypothetical protein ACFQMA_06100 [Halosimplex aquaticum]|uniref:DUF7310 domain-containing protein n=1 Tax=Halosimplex aquaticum TaxID=3026162 RepID=A0ABD5XW77_9EURY|nr:hypothetical protein [Halosimplex aquaticum]
MSERDLEARLDAVERALTDDGTDLTDLRETADAVSEASDLASRVTELESRVAELEAGLQAVRGYAGNVRAVNREVERRASAALAKAETLEATVEDDASAGPTVPARNPDDRARDDRVASSHDADPSANPRENGNGFGGQSADVGEAPGNSTTPEGANVGPSPDESQSANAGARRSPSTGVQSRGPGTHASSGRAQRGNGATQQGDGATQPDNGATKQGTGGDPSGGGPVSQDGSAPQPGRQSGGGGRGRSQPSRPDGGEREGDEPGPAEAESQTEQFIERVRDAL